MLNFCFYAALLTIYAALFIFVCILFVVYIMLKILWGNIAKVGLAYMSTL